LNPHSQGGGFSFFQNTTLVLKLRPKSKKEFLEKIGKNPVFILI
jgi:hypothetical protein